jgi:two-component system, OmpR family, sensor kinase
MTLRTKLVISFTLLLLAVIAAVGLVASRSIRSILIGQIDQDLQRVVSRGPGPFGDGPPGPRPDDGPFLEPYAVVVTDAGGTVIDARPSGFADEPDPLPDVSGLDGEEGLVTLPSVDGSIDYRGYVEREADGSVAVHAVPLRDFTTATSGLIRALLVAGGGVLLLGGAATWWTVRGAMRPVDEMVETAEAIAAGDLTRRVPDLDPGTELGRLGGSLNEMLAHIEQAVDSEREGRERLRQFVADASHELRTPLAAISGYAEMHRTGALATGAEEAKAWSRIESEGRRMGNLVEDLLTLTRLGQAKPLRIEQVDLARVCRDAAADHSAIDPERSVTVSGPQSLLVRGDAERLHQVVTSLLANVRVHTPPGTHADVTVGRQNGTIELVVSDDGPGMPPQALAHVFDRFYRVDSSRSRRSGGSGLGLSIVDAIVTAHGGTVSADSTLGAGTSITVRLPQTEDGRRKMEAHPNSVPPEGERDPLRSSG